MAISVDWGTKVITIAKADTQLVSSSPNEIRSLNLDTFRLALKDLEDSEAGMPHLDTHRHNTTVTVGGVTLARVVEIINGYTVTFEDGAYAVNLVGANSNIGDVVNFNQVQIRSANSAGLTYSEAINDQSFANGQVYIDTVDGQSGTQFPRGTPPSPVDNFVDAHVISVARGFHDFHVVGTLVIAGTDSLDYHALYGNNQAVVVSLGASSVEATFYDLVLVNSQMAGTTVCTRCSLQDVTDFAGDITSSGLYGDITLSASATRFSLTNSASLVAGTARPNIDFNDASVAINVRNYTGGLTLSNITQGNVGSFDMQSGTIEFDASCTSGSVVVRGNATLIDNSGPGFTVNTTGLIQPSRLLSVAKFLGLK